MKDKNESGTSAQFNAPPQYQQPQQYQEPAQQQNQQPAQPYAQQQYAQPQQPAAPYQAQPNYSAPQPDYRVQSQPVPAASPAVAADTALEIRENKVAGVVGAFLFALAGAVVYVILDRMGIISAFSGLIAAVCAFKGYSVFAKKESTFGAVISIVMAFVVIALAWYICLSIDVYQSYISWYNSGDIDYKINFFDALRSAHLYLGEEEIGRAYFANLAMGLMFCLLGCISPITAAVRRAKSAKVGEPPLPPQAYAQPPYAPQQPAQPYAQQPVQQQYAQPQQPAQPYQQPVTPTVPADETNDEQN